MHEFQTFVYLGMQKTGSTFISALLKKFSTETGDFTSHQPTGPDSDRSKFYFISVRDPLDAYLSLYSFGCEARGKTRNTFKREGGRDFYDGTARGFNAWLSYVLRPKNAAIIDKPYSIMGSGRTAKLVGLQSWRYLRLATPHPAKELAACRNADDIRALYSKTKLPRYVVRHENFVPDLIALVRGPLAYAIGDVDEAVKFIETAKPLNTSDRIERYEGEIVLRPRAAEKLREREWFLREEFGY